ncbi:MAG: EAL domain-containing protein [Sulfuricurvum sp.]|uniref:EAL domain-containing protein n=1 Tax=Sulfuricurvum sp. TaxID=2025608 RepID=UPI0027341304|nr:EAL domain-containing protein [Sulfuricurvum sp.]MDP2851527.1 EAL domain-containing protein [Sulfuricurvum sp.]
MSNIIQRLQIDSASRSVLIIDDDPELAESLKRIVQMFFKECIIATDGDEGVKTYRNKLESNESFTLVITDLELPKKGGLGVIKEIRSLSKSQPILILSAHDDADFMAEAISLEVQGYLLKPLSMPKFFQYLEKILLDTSASVVKIRHTDPVTRWKLLPELEGFFKSPLSEPVALLRIRVNYLSNIYDLVGEEYADEYVSELGALLESLKINSEGTFYRCSRDEFCLVLKNQNLQFANVLANDMVSIARYFHTSEKGIILNSTLSIGIAYGTENLLANSRLALENIIHPDTAGVMVFIQSDEERDQTIVHGREVLKMIFHALEEENIVPYVQPIVNASSGDIEIFNSFVRIRQEEKIYGPETFLNVAINTHQMTMITRSMIRNTLSLNATITPKNAILTVCLADEDLNDDALLSYIQFWTERYRLEPSRVAFELVGRAKESVSNSMFPLIKKLKAHGYKIILNRFGSGDFNLAYLFELKPDYIKIHPDLIIQLHTEPRAIQIVQKLVDIIHLVGAKAIATHLSTASDIELLRSIDIDYLQGYAVAAPYEVK